MQTLYRTATELGTEAPVATVAQVLDGGCDTSSKRVSLRECLDAFLCSVASARPGFGD
jgi:hypothetical protein